MIDKRFFSPLEISQYLGLKPDTIYSWIWQRKIPYFKIGSRVKFDIKEIEEWLKDKKRKELN